MSIHIPKVLQRGAVVNLKNGLIVVLLNRPSAHGWNVLCVSCQQSYYYRQDLFIFDTDLQEGEIIPQIETAKEV